MSTIAVSGQLAWILMGKPETKIEMKTASQPDEDGKPMYGGWQMTLFEWEPFTRKPTDYL